MSRSPTPTRRGTVASTTDRERRGHPKGWLLLFPSAVGEGLKDFFLTQALCGRVPTSARGFEVVVYAPQGFLPFDLTSSRPAALLDPSPQQGPVERSHLWLRLLSPSRAMITRSSPSGRATFGMASTVRTVMPPTRQKRSRPRRSSREGASPKGGAPFACPTSIRSKTPQKIFEPSARALDPATSRRLRDVSRSRSLAEFREFLPLGLTVLTRCA